MTEKPRMKDVYIAVVNPDGTLGEPQPVGTIDELEIVDEILPDSDERIALLLGGAEEEFEVRVEMMSSEFMKLIDPFERLRKSFARLAEQLDEFNRAARSPRPRSGFRPHKKKWESDKDDPSTFGGYMSKRRGKKRR